MSSKALLTALLALAAASRAAAEAPPCETKPWDALSDRRLTTLGREVLRAGGDSWVHGETEHFVFHAASPATLTGAVELAEYAYTKISTYVGTERAERKGHFFIVESPAVWARVQEKVDSRKYSLAMQFLNDMFILQDTNLAANVARVPHEMVHFRLWQIYGKRVPLWLDEGLASYVGWQVAQGYYRLKDRELVRALPAAPAANIQSLEHVTSAAAYPLAKGAVVAFARESEELVAEIARRIGGQNLAPLLRAVINWRVPWNRYLRDQYGFTDQDFADIERAVRDRSQQDIPNAPAP